MTGRATHGATRDRGTTPEFRSWLGMRQRCYYGRHQNYANYGGRGIEVCPQWRDSFETFLADMGRRPAGTTLDRIDSNGNYEPENCRWATPAEQYANRRKPNIPKKTHCPSGHPYSGTNVRQTKNGRKCRTCERERARAQRAAARATKAAAS